MPTIARPAPDEYNPFYGGYIAAVPDTADLLALLAAQGADTVALLRALPESRGSHRYAPGKWSIKEVVGHVVDTERVMSYRALRVARADRTPLAGFEQDDWVRASNAERRRMADLLDELQLVRASTVALFRGMDDAAFTRRGVANAGEVTTRALAWIITGHERHHVRILRERYLSEGT